MIKVDRVVRSDCFSFLSKVEDGTVDLALIDPPYNLGKGDWDTFESQEAFLDFTFSWLQEVIRTLKPDGSLYVFNTPLNSAFIANFLINKGLHYRNWLTWDKRDGFAGGTKRFVPQQETILYFSKSNKPYFAANDVRVPYESTDRIKHAAHKGILKNGKRWFPNPNGRLCGDVWHFSSHRHQNKVNGRLVKGVHPTPKPLEMIERMILASTRPGELVLDCFAGTGTTAVAAIKNDRKFIGCDNVQEYVKHANECIKNVAK